MASSPEGETSLGSYKIPALTGQDNYHSWKTNIKDILKDLKLIPHIENSLNDLIEANKGNEEKTQENNQKAIFHMHVHCSPHVQTDIESTKTAKEVWDTLKHEYEVMGIITQIYLCWKFYTVQMAEDDDFDLHHQKLWKIYQDL